MNYSIFIVVVNWNRLNDTLGTIESIGTLNIPKGFNIRTVVVDNGSSDGSIQKIKEISKESSTIDLIETGKNLGYAGGNNVGIKYSLEKGADFILILNNDVILDNNLLSSLIIQVVKEEDYGIFTPKIFFAKGFEFHRERYRAVDSGKVIWFAGGKIDWDNIYAKHNGLDEVDSKEFNKKEKSEFASGTCMLVKREVFEKVGYFDERYFLYWEDIEFSVRAEKLGYPTLYVPDAKLWHKVSQSSGIGGNLNDYYLTRNRLLFGMKWARARTKYSLVKESMRFLIKGRKWQRRGVVDFFLANFGKGSYS